MYNTKDIALNSSDDAAPETTATAEGEAQNDWYRSPVVVDFAATDEISGVAATYYRVDDGDVASGRQAVIETEGVHTVTYWSVDRAGNAEEAKSLSVSVDLTAPSIIFDVADGTEFTVDQLVATGCDATDGVLGDCNDDL